MNRFAVVFLLLPAIVSSAPAGTLRVFRTHAVNPAWELADGPCLGQPLSAGAQICGMPAGTGFKVSGSWTVRDVLTAGKLSVSEAWFGETYTKDGSFRFYGSVTMVDPTSHDSHYPPRIYSEWGSGEGRIDADIEDLETDATGVKVIAFSDGFLRVANTDRANGGGYIAYPTTYAGSSDSVVWDKEASTATRAVFRTLTGKPARFGVRISATHAGSEAHRDLRWIGPAGR